jgi:ABC-type spermidine/putrescine transport system permease subunit II
MDQLTLRQPVLTGEATSAPVKRGREAGFLALFLVFALYLIVPMIGMALFSVGDSWIDTVLPRRFTLDYWTAAHNNPLFLQTFTRSFIATAGTIALSLVLMTPTLFVLHVAAPRLRPFVEVVSLAPFALPTVVFALSLIRTYSVKPLVLTGTPLLLVLSTSFGEYTLSAFLVGDAWKTSGVWIYDFWSDRPHETLALGTISFVVTWAASLAILALLGRRSASEVGRA